MQWVALEVFAFSRGIVPPSPSNIYVWMGTRRDSVDTAHRRGTGVTEHHTRFETAVRNVHGPPCLFGSRSLESWVLSLHLFISVVRTSYSSQLHSPQAQAQLP